MTRAKAISGVVLAIPVLIVAIQNAHSVRVRFFGWSTEISLVLILLVTLLVGAMAGAATAGWWRRSGRRGE